MRPLLCVLAAASLLLGDVAAITAGLALSPPYRVSSLTPVTLWAALPTGACPPASGCTVTVTLSAKDRAPVTHTFPVSVPSAGEVPFARLHVASLNVSAWTGALTIHATIQQVSLSLSL
eukprot:COSAG03_NODE_8761_length_773_cov_1.176558_1_plen_118_part_01